MSHLLVITIPTLVTGFRLAGVEAYGADDVESAEEQIASWLDAGETGLLAIDERFLGQLDPGLIRRLQAAEHLPYMAIPSVQPSKVPVSRRRRIVEMLRQAIGVHITFKGEETKEET